MEFLNTIGGYAIALFGAGMAAFLACVGSAIGTGIAGEAAAGLTAENPQNKALVLQVLPGTQGLYGFVIWFVAFGMLNPDISVAQGMQVLSACLPIAIGGLLSAVAQGKVAAASVNIIAKHPNALGKGLIYCVVVELYAILSMLASFLMLNGITL